MRHSVEHGWGGNFGQLIRSLGHKTIFSHPLHPQGYAMILEDKTPNKATGHWKNYELEALKSGLEEFGPDWPKIAELIPTRSWSQVREGSMWRKMSRFDEPILTKKK